MNRRNHSRNCDVLADSCVAAAVGLCDFCIKKDLAKSIGSPGGSSNVLIKNKWSLPVTVTGGGGGGDKMELGGGDDEGALATEL